MCSEAIRPNRPAHLITLANRDWIILEAWVRSRKTAQALSLRARIILACAEPAATNSGVARTLGVSRPTVQTWRQRFAQHGLDGPLDEPRPGAPRRITDVEVERVITTALETEPTGAATPWSTRSMAQATGMSQSAVSRTWRALALQPHRCETFKLSRDPLFVDKVRDPLPTSPTVSVRLMDSHPGLVLTPIIQVRRRPTCLIRRPRLIGRALSGRSL